MEDKDSAQSSVKRSNLSSSDEIQDRKEFLRRFIDREILKEAVANWFKDTTKSDFSSAFPDPFKLIDLQKFDYALGGVRFLQLFRIPNTIYASTSSSVEAASYLALEDFLHSCVTSLWGAFWGNEDALTAPPFFVSSLHGAKLRFYQAEKAVSKGKVRGLCGSSVVVKNPRHPHPKWDDVVALALMSPDLGSHVSDEEDSRPPVGIISEALFFALRVLLARSVTRSRIPMGLNSVFVILVDSQNGCVIKVEGDVNKLELHLNNVYTSAATWFRNHSTVAVSPVDRIWNKLGNANWHDIGALRVLYATFHSLMQCAGMPKHSIEDLAAEHSSRLQARRYERLSEDQGVILKDSGSSQVQHRTAHSEITEIQEDYLVPDPGKLVKLQAGNVVLVEYASRQQGYKIDEVVNDGEVTFYTASPVEDPGTQFFLHIGLTSQQEPGWEGMNLWYKVQRQAKLLSVMRQKGVSSKYLPQLVASGRVVHSGQCRIGCANLCGAPVLVTSPVGRSVAEMVRAGEFGADEAIRCCHDCLSALSSSSAAGIWHGNINPGNVISVKSNVRQPYYVLTGWGRAILEERDRPAMDLLFSSTSALEDGSLCPASDAESLLYMLYISTGGELPVLESVEGALRWRETSWSRRLIQQKLGDISAVLKAFADYVDSLCGTPYPVDYEIWLRRLRRHVHGEEYVIQTRCDCEQLRKKTIESRHGAIGKQPARSGRVTELPEEIATAKTLRPCPRPREDDSWRKELSSRQAGLLISEFTEEDSLHSIFSRQQRRQFRKPRGRRPQSLL